MKCLILYVMLLELILSGSALTDDIPADRRQPRCKKPLGKPGQTLVKSCTDKEVCTLDAKNKARWQTCPIAASGEDLAAMDSKLNDVDSKIDGVDSKINGVDSKIDGVDSKIDGVDSKIDGVDSKIDGLDSKIDGVDSKIDGLDSKIDKQHIEIIRLLRDIIGPTTLLQSTMVTPAAPVWRKVYGLNIAGGPFANLDETKKKNIDDPDADQFSILYDLETMKNSHGVFHFKLCYPELTPHDFPCNEWIQTSNPVTEQKISGYSGITINYNTNGIGGTFKGLGLSPPSFNYNLIDAAPDSGNWFYSIGTIYNILAGPSGQAAVKIVELSVLYTPSG